MEAAMKIQNLKKFALLSSVFLAGCFGGGSEKKAEVKPEEAKPAVKESQASPVAKKSQGPSQETVIAELKKNLESKDPLRKAHGILGLQYHNASDMIPVIHDFLKDYRNPTVQKAAVQALAGFGDTESLREFYTVFAKQRNKDVRYVILSSFEKLHDSSTVDFLSKWMSRLDPYLASIAYKVLKQIKPPVHFSDNSGRVSLDSFTISGLLGRGPSARIQVDREFFSVGDTIYGYKIQKIDIDAKLVHLEKDGKIVSKPIDNGAMNAEDKAIESLNSDDDQRVYKALMELSYLQSNKPSAELISLIQGKNSDDIRIAAIEVSGQSGIEKASDVIREVLRQEKRSDYLIAALRAASDLGMDNILELLEPLAQHANPWVRNAAIFTIGELGNEFGIPALVQRLDDQYTFVRNNAYNQLITFAQMGFRNRTISFVESSMSRSSSEPEITNMKKALVEYLKTLPAENDMDGDNFVVATRVENVVAAKPAYRPGFNLISIGSFMGKNLISYTNSSGERVRAYEGDALDGGVIGKIDPDDESFRLELNDGKVVVLAFDGENAPPYIVETIEAETE
jgi:HEAT repeat protein